MEPSGYIIVTLKFWQEKGRWVGSCLELSTGAVGETLEEAKTVLMELVELHLDGLEDIGERERFFKEHGIKFYRRKPTRRAEKIEMRIGEIAERQLVPVLN